jgi:hypothetical protein
MNTQAASKRGWLHVKIFASKNGIAKHELGSTFNLSRWAHLMLISVGSRRRSAR